VHPPIIPIFAFKCSGESSDSFVFVDSLFGFKQFLELRGASFISPSFALTLSLRDPELAIMVVHLKPETESRILALSASTGPFFYTERLVYKTP
jgi:hypothetical protein